MNTLENLDGVKRDLVTKVTEMNAHGTMTGVWSGSPLTIKTSQCGVHYFWSFFFDPNTLGIACCSSGKSVKLTGLTGDWLKYVASEQHLNFI